MSFLRLSFTKPLPRAWPRRVSSHRILQRVFCAGFTACLAGVVTLGLTGCGGDPPVAATRVTDPLWQLHLTPKAAVTRVAGDSVQLHAITVGMNNDTTSIAPTELAYTSADTTYATVTPTGVVHLLRATQFGTPVPVSAAYTVDNRTVQDTVLLFITTSAVAIDSISFNLPDSVFLGLSPTANQLLFPTVWGTDGLPHPEVGLSLFVKNDPSVDLLSGSSFAFVFLSGLGTHWIYGMVNAYGQQVVDSVALIGTYSTAQSITLSNAPVGSGLIATPTADGVEFYLASCGTMTWTNTSTAPLDITFDAPANTGGCAPGDVSGNITSLAPGASESRAFPGTKTTTWSAARSATPNTILLSGTIVTKQS